MEHLKFDIFHETNFSQVLIENANLVINVWSLDGKLVSFNRYAQELTGFSEAEVLGDGWRGKFVNDQICPDIDELFQRFQTKDTFPITEAKILTKKGEIIEILWINNLIYNKEGNRCGAVSIGMDITDNKNYKSKLEESYKELNESYKSIRKLALYDSLTELPNIGYAYKILDELLEGSKTYESKFALLLMDLDNFKYINDTLGHSIGDKLLRGIADRFIEISNNDLLCYRFGGDEFIFLIKNVNSDDEVRKYARQILDALSEKITVECYELNITASIGAAIYPEGGNNSENLFKNADIALHRAKELGKNLACIFSQELKTRIIEKTQLERDMKKAIEKNEFVIYYQPQIDTVSEELVGAEALVRWIHPIHGYISPLKFIPIAEETGFINTLGHWVLNSACTHLKEWKKKGYKRVEISVNLSLKQLQDKDIANKVYKILQDTEIEPKDLVLEITESISMQNVEHTVTILNALRELGISIALDDFGTGYSSLNYLTHLPICSVKLDKTFMNDIVEKQERQIVAKSIVELAQKLNLSVIAEGVETKEQLELLRSYKCNTIQGYLYSKPLPVDEFEKLYLMKNKAISNIENDVI